MAKHLQKLFCTFFLSIIFFLDKYEPSLYKNVEEIACLMTRPAPEEDAKSVLN